MYAILLCVLSFCCIYNSNLNAQNENVRMRLHLKEGRKVVIPLNDIDSITYESVTITDSGYCRDVLIGKQIWMSCNLDVDVFRNGDTIFQAKTSEDWNLATEQKKPCWAYYQFNTDTKSMGKYYNWYAINDERGLAPIGYRIPEISDWQEMYRYLGEGITAASMLKGNSSWVKGNDRGGGSNTTGFSAAGNGRTIYGRWDNAGDSGYWWTKSYIGNPFDPSTISIGIATELGAFKYSGMSVLEIETYQLLNVRCIRE